jgi:putative endonuclease
VSTREVGRQAEQQAVDYLKEQGFTIRDINWQQGQKEIDIVAVKNGMLHIVEVRSLSSTSIMQPYQSVNRQKQKNLIRAANAYIEKYGLDMEVQFDIISLVRNKGFIEIEYIPNAFYPQL